MRLPFFVDMWSKRQQTMRESGMAAVAEATLPIWFSEATRAKRPGIVEAARAMIAGTSEAGYLGASKALQRLDYKRRLADIRCPTLFLVGAQDGPHPSGDARHGGARSRRRVRRACRRGAHKQPGTAGALQRGGAPLSSSGVARMELAKRTCGEPDASRATGFRPHRSSDRASLASEDDTERRGDDECNERFTPFERADLDERQQQVFDDIASGPRGTVPWIFHLYLNSPELASHVQRLGAFCRYGTSLPPRLSELAILVVANHWKADYEWSIHAREARKAGLPDEVIAAIEAGRRPAFDDADAELVYDFATEFFRTERRA